MTTLGAILAGGKSSRFGSDKAVARLGGKALIDHARGALSAQCDAVLVVGRDVTDAPSAADWPAPDTGPLGGIAAALHHARDNGHDRVLTCGVDSVGLPRDLLQRLSPAPAYVESQPVVGLWPTTSMAALEKRLLGNTSRSVRAFAEDIGARAVAIDIPLANVNTPADLERLEQHHGL